MVHRNPTVVILVSIKELRDCGMFPGDTKSRVYRCPPNTKNNEERIHPSLYFSLIKVLFPLSRPSISRLRLGRTIQRGECLIMNITIAKHLPESRQTLAFSPDPPNLRSALQVNQIAHQFGLVCIISTPSGLRFSQAFRDDDRR